MMSRKLQVAVALTVVAASVLAFGASPALAGRKPRVDGGTTSATCWATPNPVAAGAVFTINGNKYQPYQYLTLAIASSGGTSFVWTQADANGNLSRNWQIFTTGSNSIKVYSSIGNALLAACSVTTF